MGVGRWEYSFRLAWASCSAWLIFWARLGLVVQAKWVPGDARQSVGLATHGKTRPTTKQPALISFAKVWRWLSASAIEKCTAVTTTGITWSALFIRSHPGGA